MLAYSLFFGHGSQKKAVQVTGSGFNNARCQTLFLHRQLSPINFIKAKKGTCTAHYNIVIAQVTKQMFTNVKTKKNNILFYNSVL